MKPDDVESLLARYRPAGPGADLRARVLAAPAARQRVVVGTWVGVATLAACSVFFFRGAGDVYDGLEHAAHPGGAAARLQVDAGLDDLGGDPIAQGSVVEQAGPSDDRGPDGRGR